MSSHVSKISAGAGVLLGLSLLAGCQLTSEAPKSQDRAAMVQRGAYLVTVAACNDCHTPMKLGPNGPEPDLQRMLSGHPEGFAVEPPAGLPPPWTWAGTSTNTAFAGPWGVTFAKNLTPDAETGLGVYTEATFIQAMRTGKHMGGGRPIDPPMPWQSCAKMTDEDLKAIYAYLKSIPSVRNAVPEPLPPPATNPDLASAAR